jgi:hypothetical protein
MRRWATEYLQCKCAIGDSPVNPVFTRMVGAAHDPNFKFWPHMWNEMQSQPLVPLGIGVGLLGAAAGPVQQWMAGNQAEKAREDARKDRETEFQRKLTLHQQGIS